MKLPKGFIKNDFDRELHEKLIARGSIRCPITGLYYNPNSGSIYGSPHVYREIESRSRHAKILIKSKETLDFTEMKLVDFIWEIMTGKEPPGKVSVKAGFFKVCTQWENLEMEIPDYEVQSNFFTLLECPDKMNLPFKSPKERKKFLKQTEIYKTAFQEIFGGPPKKFISGVDYLRILNESRGNRKIRTLDDQKE